MPDARTTPRTHPPTRRVARGLLAFVPLAALLSLSGGCAVGARERHLAARGDFVPFREGDGRTRVSVWPPAPRAQPAAGALSPRPDPPASDAPTRSDLPPPGDSR